MKPVLINRRFQYSPDDEKAFLGQGAMGTVYRGLDMQSEQPVAIKLLKSDVVARDPEMVQRFQLEGEALRQLNHPNIVKMLDATEQDRVHYLIMEYVGGGSLRDVLDTQPRFSIQRTLYIALDLADALTRAHRLKILHRDIKPGNVLIADDGTPRLTDFGMARFSDAPNITQDGAIIGTMAYLAPEAFHSEAPDERTDIWAFGVMLYEMLAGERPFPQHQPAALVQAIMTQPIPDLEKARPDAPTALVDLVYRMLSKERQARIPSVRLIGAELESILRGGSTTLQPIVSVEDSTGRFDLDTTEFPVLIDEKPAAKSNLPNPPTAFVGREADLEALKQFVDQKTHLISLVGPGGMGKSRLALAFAQHMINHFRDGVFFVPLASLESVDYITPAIAETIGLNFGSGEAKSELMTYISEKQMLIVLDNFEHLMDAANLVSEINASAPDVVLMVSSRERLRLRGEQVYEVEGLNLPTKADETPEKLTAFPAVKLFMQSAHRVVPDFEISDKQVAHEIAEIIRLVGGLPLGIELAATWLEALPLHEIITEIEKSLDFLETDLRDVPERHRSVRAVFDYSWNLLNEEERRIFMKLSVFRGGFEREAAQKVADASLRNLTNLVNKSLLLRSPEGRYSVPKLLRQYAEERFQQFPDEKIATYYAHANYYTLFASRLQEAFNSAKEMIAVDEMDKEIENVRLVWRNTIKHGFYNVADTIQDTMLYYYTAHSMQYEGYESFKLLADSVEKTGQKDAIYWRARNRQSWIALRMGKYDEVISYSQGALDFFGDTPASTENAIAHNNLSYVSMMRGDYDGSINHAMDAIKYIDQVADDRVTWYMGMGNLGYALYLKGDYKEARKVYEDILSSGVEYGPTGIAYGKNNLGEVLREMGEVSRAKQLFEEAYEAFASLNQRRSMGFSLLNLGGIVFMQGDYGTARQHYERAYEISQEIGDLWAQGHAVSNLGNLELVAANHEMASQKFRSALAIRQKLGDKRGIADSMTDLARCAFEMGDLETAGKMMDDALVIQREIGDKMGVGYSLAGRGMSLLLMGDIDAGLKDVTEAIEIGEAIGSPMIMIQSYAALGESYLQKCELEQSTDYFQRVLKMYSDDSQAPITMILWALLGIARIRLAQGDRVKALELVTVVMRYPRSYISMLEGISAELLEQLTTTLDDKTVESTMTASKNLTIKALVADLIAV